MIASFAVLAADHAIWRFIEQAARSRNRPHQYAAFLQLVPNGDMRRHRGCVHALAEIGRSTVSTCIG